MAKRCERYNPLLKSFPESEKINRVSEGAEVLYVRLLAATDDNGRYFGDPAWIAMKLFTVRTLAGQVDAAEIDRRLTELESVSLLKRYRAGPGTYLELIDVFKKFRSDVKRQELYPPPDTETRAEPEPPALRVRPEPEPNAGHHTSTSGTTSDPNPTPHTRAPDVKDMDAHEYNWKEAARVANRASKTAWPVSADDWSLLLKAAALSERLGENWFLDSIEAVQAAYTKSNRPTVPRCGYLHDVLRDRTKQLGQDFNRLLARVHVPDAITQEITASEAKRA